MSQPLSSRGHRIVSVGDTGHGGRIMIGIGLFFIGVGVLVGLGVWSAEQDPGAWIFTGVMSLVGVIFLALSRRPLKVAGRFEPGVLDTDREVFTLGSAAEGRFTRTVKKGSTDVRSIEAYLLLQEWVRWQQGTDTRTATREIHRYPVQLTHRIDPQAVVADLSWRFPTYPPSFDASNNEVRWRLVVHLEMADGFTEDSVVPLWVVPAIHVADRPDVEDAR